MFLPDIECLSEFSVSANIGPETHWSEHFLLAKEISNIWKMLSKTFCLIVFLSTNQVFGWTGSCNTPEKYEKSHDEKLDETLDNYTLFHGFNYTDSFDYNGILYPLSRYPEHQKQEKDHEVRDGRKLLVVTGWPLTFGQRMEIIDLGNKNFTCDECKLPRYPSKSMGGTGGLINKDTVMICGGFPYEPERRSPKISQETALNYSLKNQKNGSKYLT